ncbi:hypothetical protein D3C80_1579350 [compost metagenome]
MAEVAGTVQVLVAARQWCGQAIEFEGEGAAGIALVERIVERLQGGLDLLPVVEGRLQGRRDGAGFDGAAKVAADHQQDAVAAGFS